MSVRSRRLAVAAVTAAAMIAVPIAAVASSSSTSSGKPPPSAAASKSAAAASKSAAAASKSAARQSGALRRVTEAAMVAAIAAQLGVSHGAAQRALNQLDALSGTGGVDPASPAFATIARDLGVSAARLAAALPAAKQAAGRSVAG